MATRRSKPVDDGAIVVGLSALVVVIGAFLGWFTVPVAGTLASIDGLDLFDVASPVFNGLVTAGLATVVTVLALLLSEYEAVNVVTAVAGLAIELIAVAFIVVPDVAFGPTIQVGDVPLSAIGVGVYMTILGGIGILLGGTYSYRR